MKHTTTTTTTSTTTTALLVTTVASLTCFCTCLRITEYPGRDDVSARCEHVLDVLLRDVLRKAADVQVRTLDALATRARH